MIPGKRVVHPEEAPAGVLDGVKVKYLSEPSLTNAEHISVVHVTLPPGQGHPRHNHPGSEEIIYVLTGEGEQMVETDLEENGGQPEYFPVKTGDLIQIPASVFHLTINKGTSPLEVLAIYSPLGPEAVLRTVPDFRWEVLPQK